VGIDTLAFAIWMILDGKIEAVDIFTRIGMTY
jgi:hypothetical protein